MKKGEGRYSLDHRDRDLEQNQPNLRSLTNKDKSKRSPQSSSFDNDKLMRIKLQQDYDYAYSMQWKAMAQIAKISSEIKKIEESKRRRQKEL